MKHLNIEKEKRHQLRMLYPVKLSLKNEGEIKTLSDKQKLIKYVASRPALQEMLKEVL